MKNFKQFIEEVDPKTAALRDKQKQTVAKFKQNNEVSSPPQKSERKIHQGDLATQALKDKKIAKAKAVARKAEIRAEIQKEKDDK